MNEIHKFDTIIDPIKRIFVKCEYHTKEAEIKFKVF